MGFSVCRRSENSEVGIERKLEGGMRKSEKKERGKMRRCEGGRRNESIADWRGKAQQAELMKIV